MVLRTRRLQLQFSTRCLRFSAAAACIASVDLLDVSAHRAGESERSNPSPVCSHRRPNLKARQSHSSVVPRRWSWALLALLGTAVVPCCASCSPVLRAGLVGIPLCRPVVQHPEQPHCPTACSRQGLFCSLSPNTEHAHHCLS